ncbi:MAG: PrsW family intramembrane metalloprotease [Verrucomicrobiota bacterium]
MPLPPAKLAHLSRNRQFLIRASLILSVVSVVIALVVSLLSPAQQSPPQNVEVIEKIIEQIKEDLAKEKERAEPETFEEWVTLIRIGIPTKALDRIPDARAIVDESEDYDGEPKELRGIEGKEAEMVHALDLGLRLGDPDAGGRILSALPVEMQYRNEFLGDIDFVQEKYLDAAEHYLEETRNHSGSRYSSRSFLISIWRSGDRDALKEALTTSQVREHFSLSEQLDLYTDARDFKGLAFAVLRYEVALFFTPPVFPALFTGTIWFLILMPFWELNRARLTLSLLAVLAGIVSAGLTLYAVMIQERMQGFIHDPTATPLNQVIFYVAGVGLREETLKILCFLPFAIWAGRRGKYLDGLILAALVGLGFAFKENILYFSSGLSSFTAWTRFLTANVLHFALTGILGYYLVRLIHRKFHGLESFLIAFIGAVCAHGLYNSVIAVPQFDSYSPLSTIFVAIMAYQFFDPLKMNMDTRSISRRVSPLGVFVLGSALIACGLMVASAWITPFRFALGVFAASVASLVPLAFAYISRFRDL